MSTAVGDEQLRVSISPDHSKAELIVPAGFPGPLLTSQYCQHCLRQQGIPITAQVIEAIESFFLTPPDLTITHRLLIARATPPVHGKDASIQWDVDRQQEQNNQESNHYERTPFIMVKPGQILGRVIAPTPGQDGRDVLGLTIPAKNGAEFNQQLDESVLLDPSGQLVAQWEGSLCRLGSKIAVHQIMQINTYVDFSTGNVDFVGDVSIAKGIRDSFVVTAGGNLDVAGLIEAATIQCGIDMTAHGGMAGQGRGSVTVGGNLSARYLDNIQGQIAGDLCVKREIINCSLVVHGSLRSPDALLIGGKLTIAGAAQIASLGSSAGVASEIVIGTIPSLEPYADQLEKLLALLTARKEKLSESQKLIQIAGSRLTPEDKERQTHIAFELPSLRSKAAIGQATLDVLLDRINECRVIDVTFRANLYAGSVVTCGRCSYIVKQNLKGPIKILADANGNLIYQPPRGSGGLLAKIAAVKARKD